MKNFQTIVMRMNDFKAIVETSANIINFILIFFPLLF